MDEKNREAKTMLNDRLSGDQLQIIEKRGTERPGTGELLENHDRGTYVCGRCGAPLYDSTSKFDSHCGWPSFDDELEGAVTRLADGSRVEIRCASCDGHLGHVFQGEGFTPKNTRHCVNSLSMRFIPEEGEVGRAVFAGGCFWGVEHLFRQQEGVLETTVGYSGGTLPYPSYQDVCYKDTGHLEVIEVLYDTNRVSYEDLTRFFFEIHDPTQENGQGPDLGLQYLSVVFYLNQSQKETAEKLMALLKQKGYQIKTELKRVEAFWPAELYHQDYYEKNGSLPYCHRYTKRF